MLGLENAHQQVSKDSEQNTKTVSCMRSCQRKDLIPVCVPRLSACAFRLAQQQLGFTPEALYRPSKTWVHHLRTP